MTNPDLLTLATVKSRLSFYDLVMRRVDGEFQVKPRNTRWDGPKTYFTNDIVDALQTGLAMAATVDSLAARIEDVYTSSPTTVAQLAEALTEYQFVELCRLREVARAKER